MRRVFSVLLFVILGVCKVQSQDCSLLWKCPKDKSSEGLIFTKPLVKEFKEKYGLEFGHNEVNQDWYSMYEFQERDISFQDENERRSKFGELMIRRLVEVRMDEFVRNDSRFRTAYELRHKLSQVEVETEEGLKLGSKYSLSANDLEVTLKKSSLELKWVLPMGPRATESFHLRETLQVSYRHSRYLTSETNYFVKSQSTSVGITQHLKDDMLTHFSVGSYDYNVGEPLSEVQYVAHFLWRY